MTNKKNFLKEVLSGVTMCIRIPLNVVFTKLTLRHCWYIEMKLERENTGLTYTNNSIDSAIRFYKVKR